MALMQFHLYLMQKASALAYISAMEGMIDLMRCKGEEAPEEITYIVRFFGMVGKSRLGKQQFCCFAVSHICVVHWQELRNRLLKQNIEAKDLMKRLADAPPSPNPVNMLGCHAITAILFFSAVMYQSECQ